MLLSSYKTWRWCIKIRKIERKKKHTPFWGTHLYSAKRRKWISSHWLKRWLKATNSIFSKQITDKNPSPSQFSHSQCRKWAWYYKSNLTIPGTEQAVGTIYSFLGKFLFLQYTQQSSLLDKLYIRENTCSSGCQQLFIFQTLKEQIGENLPLVSHQRFCWIH